MPPKQVKDWDRVMAEYSSGEDEDEHDLPHYRSVQRNALRCAEVVAALFPEKAPPELAARGALPMGINRPSAFMRQCAETRGAARPVGGGGPPCPSSPSAATAATP